MVPHLLSVEVVVLARVHWTGSVIGVDAVVKPFPSIVEEYRVLFRELEPLRVLEIGAGRGRFVRWFLQNFRVEEYVAVEPYPRYAEVLTALRYRYPQLRVIPRAWEECREEVLVEYGWRSFDVLVLWDVVMFMDLRSVHRCRDVVEAVKLEVPTWVELARKYILFSLHPVKSALVPRERFREIYAEFEKYCTALAKRYLNRIYLVRTYPQRGSTGVESP